MRESSGIRMSRSCDPAERSTEKLHLSLCQSLFHASAELNFFVESKLIVLQLTRLQQPTHLHRTLPVRILLLLCRLLTILSV